MIADNTATAKMAVRRLHLSKESYGWLGLVCVGEGNSMRHLNCFDAAIEVDEALDDICEDELIVVAVVD